MWSYSGSAVDRADFSLVTRRQPVVRMIVLLLGCPGCGKTTQGERLFARFGLPQIVAAEVVKESVASGEVAPGPGGEVPDEDVARAILQYANAEHYMNGFSLEGFPNTVRQWAAFQKLLSTSHMKISAALHFDIGNEEWLSFAQPMMEAMDRDKLLFTIDGRPFVEDVEEQVFGCLTGLSDPAPEPEPGLPGAASSEEMTQVMDEPEEDPDSLEAQVKKVKWIDPRRSGDLRFGANLSLMATTQHSRVYGSNRRYREDLGRHERLKHDPSVKYPTPVTASMEYGWDSKDPALYKKDPEMFHPRMKSRETMYAEALILGPRHP